MQTLLLWLFYLSSFYAFIPGLITRIFGFRVFRRGTGKQDFALTFDDGPDPVYTPQLLDLLKRYDMKATFFLVGSHAESHPDVVKQIHEEGHLIGIHNYIHKSNWLMRPKTVRMQLKRTDDIIYSVTGERPTFYRPPWGIVNLFDFAKNSGYRIVLWSAMFGDWRSKTGSNKLVKRILRKLKPGEVMLLHDCGTTVGANPDAPMNMLIALEQVLEEAQRRNLKSIRIDTMINSEKKLQKAKLSIMKRMVVSLWLLWEKVFHVLFQLETVTPKDPMLHFRPISYQGKAVTMDDGTRLEKGDQVLELHFDNKKLFHIGSRSRSEMQLAIQMIRAMQKDLPTLANMVLERPEYMDIKGLYGVTMISRGPEQFGFHVQDLPQGLFASSARIYLKILLSIIHPRGQSRLKEGSKKMEPKLLMMPVDVLINRYAEKGSRSYRSPKQDSAEEHELSDLPIGSASQGLSS
ncbi:Peptidoglycan/xylan/chitin deacetylase, PgdA/CDA1 family [Paenibacillus uliginis N3/975]|uniref:Peptidoglycan/xylan/chitin deacetylase, PgdA/CDA1 family n=1 Tax=Paenibacillus uliginis N3/975 TaxID=1313296 RepID=A0A1X7HLV3_9BACL|nr:polysaccharide deacetylase family protein [Paenibacillus uliginis]SMF88969.1 Peptidoglycan/xylan/chitin deacetylase, PgdA/CDA1 family [Paenibacillus uliginis N3/975]